LVCGQQENPTPDVSLHEAALLGNINHYGGNVMENQEAYQRAKKRVEARLGFYIHLSVYIAVNILLIIINLRTSPEYIWFKWPLIGWGIGVFFHALSVFVFSGGSAIKEQMIEKEMKKEALKKQ
jgi:hypothetical protein